MDINKALLSQREIDVLIKYLNNKAEVVGGEVLEQTSIDKLIHILRTQDQKLFFDSDVPQFRGGTAMLVLDEEANLGEQQKFCELECEVDSETKFIKIICVNKESGNRYNMTPTCLEKVAYIKNDQTEWGYAVPPLTFDTIATLLQVKYSKATFDKVCETYAEMLYGDKGHMISSIYMPASRDLLHHLLD